MKKIFYYFLSVILLSACSETEEALTVEDNTETSGVNGPLYIEVRANLASQNNTKADDNSFTNSDGTSSDGTENATSAESQLYSADVYLWDGSSTPVQLEYDSKTGTGPYTVRAIITYDQLKGFANSKPQLLVIGNGKTSSTTSEMAFASAVSSSAPMNDKFSVTTFDTKPIGDYGESGQTMPFVNATKYIVDFSSIDATNDLTLIHSIRNLFGENGILNLSTVPGGKSLELERAVARVDYGDARSSDIKNGCSDNVYELGDVANHTLKLHSIQLFNVSTEAYIFRHTLAGTYSNAYGTPANSVTLFEPENGSTDTDNYTWIVDTDWSSTPSKGTSFINDYATLSGTDGRILISELMKTGSGARTKSNTYYYPWRYIMENTIPAGSLMTDENLSKYATGVKLTFKVCTDKTGSPQAKINSGDVLTLTMPSTHPTQPYYYQDINYTDGTGEEAGYFLTYYAFIKHNDGDDVTIAADNVVPAPMKYAIVRNNVYMLSVQNVKNLPDPKKIETMFLELKVEIKPWVRRMNDIYL